MSYEMIDLPAWVHDIIQARATAAGMGFEEALIASLDIRAADAQAESMGWAASRGISRKVIARRTHYSVRTVDNAVSRWRRRGER